MDTLTALFITISAQFNLPPGLLEAVCFVESTHNVSAYHPNDGGTPSFGVCQIKFETAQWIGFTGDSQTLMKPKVNIYYAAKYLSRNLKRYPGNIEKAVIAYNRGSVGTHSSTKYSQKVISYWRSKYNENNND